ncbi:Bacterial regulatory proteins, tetR family [Nocardia africana]|uniref:Bacterial regulatory proteins, tetR family n=1 Tax=Nocardia africana TaxID=134964 RepID=A0A378X6J0_9NOCA|nr:Bacterial regulatory proteins, tetR family [Nocardia africana]
MATTKSIRRRARTTALLDAAEFCLEQIGLSATTMEDIARQAGVSRATVYRHFAHATGASTPVSSGIAVSPLRSRCRPSPCARLSRARSTNRVGPDRPVSGHLGSSKPRWACARRSRLPASGFPVAFRRTGIRFLDHLVPTEELGLPCGRLTEHVGRQAPSSVRTSAGVATFHTCETRPGWVSSSSRDGGALPLGARPLAAPAASQRPVLFPRYHIPSAEVTVTRRQRGFTIFTRPVFSWLSSPRMEREPLSLHPGAPHPAVTRDARQGRRQAFEHWLGTTPSTSNLP